MSGILAGDDGEPGVLDTPVGGYGTLVGRHGAIKPSNGGATVVAHSLHHRRDVDIYFVGTYG